MLEARTSQRVAYAESMIEGQSVLDVSGADKAQKEIESLAREIEDYARSTE